jgi:hypothetical protein
VHWTSSEELPAGNLRRTLFGGVFLFLFPFFSDFILVQWVAWALLLLLGYSCDFSFCAVVVWLCGCVVGVSCGG